MCTEDKRFILHINGVDCLRILCEFNGELTISVNNNISPSTFILCKNGPSIINTRSNMSILRYFNIIYIFVISAVFGLLFFINIVMSQKLIIQI